MSTKSGTEVVEVYRRLLRYIRPYRLIIIPAILATTAYAVVTGSIPFFMEDVFQQLRDLAVGALGDAQANQASPWRLPILIAIVFAVRGVTDFLTVFGLSWAGRSAVRDLRGDLFGKYLLLPATFYDEHPSGDLISKLTFNTEQVAEALSNAVVVVIRDSMLVIVMVVVMLIYNAQLTVILLIVGPMIALLIGAMSRAFRRYSTRIQNSMGDVTRVAGQAFVGHRVVKIFAGEDFEKKRFDRINLHNFRLHLKLVATRALGDALTQYVVVLGIAAIIFLVFSGWLSEDVESPEFIAFVTAVGILLAPLKRLVNSNAAVQRGVAAADSVFAVLDQAVEETDAGEKIERSEGRIEYRDVSFRYGNERDHVVSNVSFSIEPGTTVAFVGRSGSGKSTLVSLLPRFYDSTAGEILLDGRDIRSYRLQDLRRQLSFVSQDVVLFDDTIAGNIAYGSMVDCSREEIEAAAEAAFVTEFARELPLGLDTPVGEQGSLMSGGQRQRIAIARALLKNAPVLIMDEATSALDSESEKRVQAALSRLMQNRTTLVIAHRLSTIENADQIVVVKDGTIVEVGTHAELLAHDGHYATLHRLQFAD